MTALVQKHAEKIRFALVGGANTALDFIILFGLVALGFNSIASNYISTSIAFIFSFFVNKSFTFKSTSGNVKKQFALFLLISVIALWVIQPIIIALVTIVLATTNLDSNIALFIAKLLATIASLIWNYILYAKYVFKKAA